jgi:two-component system, chemotaxis family, chemotaxis protein CheY
MVTVLIVDDSATVRTQAKHALVGAGFTVLEAADGVQALAVLEVQAVSLTVCDVNMPNMSGLELLEELKRRGIDAPVLMLTTEAQPRLVQRAKAAGAKAWIIKPFNADVLVSAVRSLTAAAA